MLFPSITSSEGTCISWSGDRDVLVRCLWMRAHANRKKRRMPIMTMTVTVFLPLCEYAGVVPSGKSVCSGLLFRDWESMHPHSGQMRLVSGMIEWQVGQVVVPNG